MHKSLEHLILMQRPWRHREQKSLHMEKNQQATWIKYGVSGWYIVPALEQYRCYKVFVTEKISESIVDVVGLSPQNVIIPIVPSADAAKLVSQDLAEVLHKLTPNAPFATINYTHHTVLRSLEELFNIIPKAAEQQSTNIHDGRRWERQEVLVEPDQVRSPVTHRYPTRQQKHQTPSPRVPKQTVRPPRVAPTLFA